MHGTFTGRLRLASSAFAIRGRFDKQGAAHFGSTDEARLAVMRPNLSPLTLALNLDVADGTNKLSGELTEGDIPFAVIDADRSLYTAARNPKPPYTATPLDLVGRYTVVLPIDSSGHGVASVPQGDGIGVVTVRPNGTARFVGSLSDGSAVAYVNSLSRSNTWPFHILLDRGRGSISGSVAFRDVPEVSDLSGSMHWFKPSLPGSNFYPEGWIDGLDVNVIGGKFTVPPQSAHASVFPDLGPVNNSGNAQLDLSGGDLAEKQFSQALNIDPTNRVSFVGPVVNALRLKIRTSGYVSGKFTHPVSGTRTSFAGVILQKQRLASGYFLDSHTTGSVGLAPRPAGMLSLGAGKFCVPTRY